GFGMASALDQVESLGDMLVGSRPNRGNPERSDAMALPKLTPGLYLARHMTNSQPNACAFQTSLIGKLN
ncbi:MAG: hypothetical protein ACTHLW_16160, partial [Verrucomicrobiota bacterium]